MKRIAKNIKRPEDPLLADRAVWDGAAPRDLSARPDHYLYDEDTP